MRLCLAISAVAVVENENLESLFGRKVLCAVFVDIHLNCTDPGSGRKRPGRKRKPYSPMSAGGEGFHFTGQGTDGGEFPQYCIKEEKERVARLAF